MMTTRGSNIHKLAAVVDVRSRDYFDDLTAVLSHLDESWCEKRVSCSLDASNEVADQTIMNPVRRRIRLQQGNHD